MTNGTRRAITHSSIYAIGNITRQLAGFLMLPVYTRHLSPSDYGVVGLLLAMLALVEVFFGARLMLAMPKFYFDAKSEQSKNSVVSTALFVTGAASLLTLIGLLLLRDQSSNLLFNSSQYSDAVGLFAVLILTQAIEYYAMTFIRIQQRPWLFITISLLKLTLQLGLNIWFVVYQAMGVTGVALGSAISSGVFALGLAIYTLKYVGLRFDRQQAAQLLGYSWPLWLGGIAGLYIGSSNRYFINMFSSTADVGLFELATKFSSILLLLVWEPFQQFWQSERFRIYSEPNAIPVYQGVFQAIAALLAIAALGVGLFADPVIRIMAAPDFHEAARAVPLLAIGVMFNCLTIYANFSFLATEQTGWIARNEYTTAFILSIALLALTPLLGFTGAAAAGMITNMAQYIIVQRAGKRVYDMKLPAKSLLAYSAVLVATLGLSQLITHENIWILIATNLAIFLVGMALISSHLLRQPMVREQVRAILPEPVKARIDKVFPAT